MMLFLSGFVAGFWVMGVIIVILIGVRKDLRDELIDQASRRIPVPDDSERFKVSRDVYYKMKANGRDMSRFEIE